MKKCYLAMALALGLNVNATQAIELKPEIFTDFAVAGTKSYIAGENGAYLYDGERYIPLAKLYDVPATWCKAVAYEKNYLVLSFEHNGLFVVDTTSSNVVKLSDDLYNKISISDSTIFADHSLDNKLDIFEIKTGNFVEPLNSKILGISGSYIASVNGIFTYESGAIETIYKGDIKRAVIQETPIGVLVWQDGLLRHYDNSGSLIEIELENKPLNMSVDGANVLVNDAGMYRKFALVNFNELPLPVRPFASTNRHHSVNNTQWVISTNSVSVSYGASFIEPTPVASMYNVVKVNDGITYTGINNELFIEGTPAYKLNGSITDIELLEHNKIAVSTTEGLFVDGREIYKGYVVGLEKYKHNLLIATDNNGVWEYGDAQVRQSPISHLLPPDNILKTQHFDNQLYVSTSDGLLVFNGDKLSEHLLKGQTKTTGVFKSNNTLYITTFNAGIFRIDEGKAIPVEGSPRLVTDSVQIDGKIIIGTNNGLFQFVDNEFLPLGNIKKHITANSITHSKGYIIAGTENAIIAVETVNNTFDVTPHLSAVRTDNVTSRHLPESIDVRQPANIYLSTPTSFITKVHYQYAVSGDAWTDAANGTIDLMGRDVGKMTIQTRASIDGVNWQKGDEFHVVLTGAWYQAAWVTALLVAFAILLFGTLVAYYRRREQAYTLMMTNAHEDVMAIDNVVAGMLLANSHFDNNNAVETMKGREVIDECLAKLGTYVLSRGGKAGLQNFTKTLESLVVHVRGSNPHITITSDVALNANAKYPPLWEIHVCRALHCALTYAIQTACSTQLSIDIHRHDDELHVIVNSNGNISLLKRIHKQSFNEVILEFIAGLINAKSKVTKNTVSIYIPIPKPKIKSA